MPSPAQSDGCDQNRGNESGGVGAGVKDANGFGTLVGGEPLGCGFDGGGEVAGLAEAEEGAADHEADDARDQRGADGGASPDEDGESITLLGAQLVDNASREEEADAVCDLKGDEDAAVVDVVAGLMGVIEAGNPTHEGQVKERLDEREDRAVHVVNGGGEKEQKTDGPTDVRLIGGRGGEARVGEAGGLDRH